MSIGEEVGQIFDRLVFLKCLLFEDVTVVGFDGLVVLFVFY